MREIKFLGTMKKPHISRSYQYSIFECEACGKRVERIRKDGIKAKGCSHKCARIGKRRGAYNEKVEISGYLYIYKPEHPNAIKRGYVAEHRLVAEGKIGRYLENDEVVHHINENKHDNRPENLQVMSNSDHVKLHAELKRRDKIGKFTL